MRTFAQEPRHRERFADLNEHNRDANMKTVYLNAAYFPAVEFVGSLATVLVIVFGGLQAIDGNIEIGVLVAFVAALNSFFDPIEQLTQLYTTYQSGMAALDKIFELLDTEPDLVDAPDATALPADPRRDRARDVSFRYRKHGEERRRSSRSTTSRSSIPPGQTVALVGATGAGKSTLAKLVARFYDPAERHASSSTATTCATITMASLRSQLGIVPQEGFLFSGTVAENIAFGRPDATPRGARGRRARGRRRDFIQALPDGLDTEVGERGVQLSAGQRQLVAFARALVADPRILILDEATSNVDVHTEGTIEHGLRRLLAGRTAIVIAHRLLHDPPGRPDRRARARPDRRAGHARRADRGATARYAALYRDWAEHAAA